jgi:hypothetical protein
METSTPVSPASTQESQPSEIHCSACKSTKTSKPAMRCLHCGDAIHTDCLFKLFQDGCNEAPKNKPDWLLKFINVSALAYRCKACIEKLEKHAPVPNSSMDTVKQFMADMDKKIQSIQEEVTKLSQSNCSRTLSASNDLPNQRQPPTYAQVITTDTVKTAVAQAIKEEQQARTDKCCVAVYGFPEEDNDNSQLMDMLDYLGCRSITFRHSRVGWHSNNTMARPIKLELPSSADASIILSRAVHLRDDEYYAGVRLSEWLSDERMKVIRQKRRQCDALNQKHACSEKGRKRFVVYDGVITELGPDGKRRPYHGELPSTSSASSSSKNVKGGS